MLHIATPFSSIYVAKKKYQKGENRGAFLSILMFTFRQFFDNT